MGETRKLAAILVSDVVGYSRLTGADEDRILARLRALRSDLIDPELDNRAVASSLDNPAVVHRDGRSVVDAVNCALEIQKAMVERNAGVAPDKRIEFRVGIHLGDVVEESDGDLMGDGVNIAARLEGVAKPGAICLSEDAYDVAGYIVGQKRPEKANLDKDFPTRLQKPFDTPSASAWSSTNSVRSGRSAPRCRNWPPRRGRRRLASRTMDRTKQIAAGNWRRSRLTIDQWPGRFSRSDGFRATSSLMQRPLRTMAATHPRRSGWRGSGNRRSRPSPLPILGASLSGEEAVAMRFKWALAGIGFTLALPVSIAMAGAFEDGVTAYERQDYATALRLFQPLADQGDASAQFNVGSMYAYGEGVPQNFAEAGKWFRRAADQGHATAQFNLGAMYAEGLGLAQDYPEAARWYRKAADQGDAITQFNLGLMYAEGQGLPRDHTESGKWFRKAADQGDANAQANLGVMYANGLGVPEDLILSCMWLNLAAAQGSEDARSARDKLVSHMTPAQIAEAERMAREWKPTK